MSIYSQNAIVDASIGSGDLFARGPFETVSEANYVDPYCEGVDVATDGGTTFLTINSWKGRLVEGTGPNEIMSTEVFELAARGGWDGDYAWQEVRSGGADVIPGVFAPRIASALWKFLATNVGMIEVDGRLIDRRVVALAAEIFEAGPTTIPW